MTQNLSRVHVHQSRGKSVLQQHKLSTSGQKNNASGCLNFIGIASSNEVILLVFKAK